MIQTAHIDAFEEALLSHVEMCYSVALTLTHNPSAAERITRTTLEQAWRRREQLNGRRNLKTLLLKMLRGTFMDACEISHLRHALYAPAKRPLPASEESAAPLSRGGCRAAMRPDVVTLS